MYKIGKYFGEGKPHMRAIIACMKHLEYALDFLIILKTKFMWLF